MENGGVGSKGGNANDASGSVEHKGQSGAMEESE